MFCQQPFESVEIHPGGEVFNCCPPYLRYYSIGNIFEEPFENIWNGEKVRNLRRHILNEDYSMCEDMCQKKCSDELINPGYTETVDKYPKFINISTDNICNVRCTICRDKPNFKKYDKNKIEEEIEKYYLPIFKNAEFVRIGVLGEPLASYKESLLIKKAIEKYPNIKFHLLTNGILGNEKKLKEIGLYDRLEHLSVSLHAATRWTYNKIVRGGSWDKVRSNLKLYKKMKDENIIDHFRFICCVYTDNYKEMPGIVKIAMKHHADVIFWCLNRNENTKLGENFEKYSAVNPANKHYKNLIKVLKDPIFKEYAEHIEFYPELKNLMS